MRPRKRVLLVCGNEMRKSLRAMMLEVRGFRVFRASTVAEATESIREAPAFYDLVMVEPPCMDLNLDSLVRLDRAGCSDTKLLIVASEAHCLALAAGGWRMLVDRSSSAEVIEAATILTTRKRGPKRVQPESDSTRVCA